MIQYEFNRKCPALMSSIPLWGRGNRTLFIKGQRASISGLQVIWCLECTWLCCSKTWFTRMGASGSLRGSIRNANYQAPPQTFWMRNSPVWVLPRQTRKTWESQASGFAFGDSKGFQPALQRGRESQTDLRAEIPTTAAIYEEERFQQCSPSEDGWRRPTTES